MTGAYSGQPSKLRNFIDGEWVEAHSYKEIPNPLTSETIFLHPDKLQDEEI